MKCVTGKKTFSSLKEAEEGLVENHIHFNHLPGNGPINFYQCDDCGQFHFTSKGEPNPILEEQKKYIQRERMARNWEHKLK